MTFSRKGRTALLGAGAIAIAALGLAASHRATASDHAGTTESVHKPGIDFSDLHIFPGSDPNNVVLAMSVHPLIPAGQGTPDKVSFDTDVLYEFKIDNTGDNVEDLVIQARFEGTGAEQKVLISGPVKPSRTGTTSVFERSDTASGIVNKAFSPVQGMKVFAGPREDPFFIDLEQLGNILPDRLVPPGLKPPPANPNQPQATSWRPPGVAKDFLANFNVLAIVVELPKSRLGGNKIHVWETASVANSNVTG